MEHVFLTALTGLPAIAATAIDKSFHKELINNITTLDQFKDTKLPNNKHFAVYLNCY